jgi:hypothetical protein
MLKVPSLIGAVDMTCEKTVLILILNILRFNAPPRQFMAFQRVNFATFGPEVFGLAAQSAAVLRRARAVAKHLKGTSRSLADQHRCAP